LVGGGDGDDWRGERRDERRRGAWSGRRLPKRWEEEGKKMRALAAYL
jgi:hypothetical protein